MNQCINAFMVLDGAGRNVKRNKSVQSPVTINHCKLRASFYMYLGRGSTSTELPCCAATVQQPRRDKPIKALSAFFL